MVELHTSELLLSGLPVRCEQAARIGAHLHELHRLFDVGLSGKHRALRRGQVEQRHRGGLRISRLVQIPQIGVQPALPVPGG